MKISILSICVALLSFGCSSSDNSTPSHTPLTPEQKLELKAFSQSGSDFGSAINGSNRLRNIAAKASTRKLMTLNSSRPGGSNDKTRRDKISRLQAEMDKCVASGSYDELADATTMEEILRLLDRGVNFDLNGQDCPLDLTAGLYFRQVSQSALAGGINLDLILRDEEFIQASRIRGFKLTGKLAASGTQTTVNFTTNVDATVVSLDHGKVAINLTGTASGSENSSSGVLQLRYTFSDFYALGEVHFSQKGPSQPATITFYINSRQVTEAEFMEYFAGTFETEKVESPITASNSSLNQYNKLFKYSIFDFLKPLLP